MIFMPIEEKSSVIPITESSLQKMPKRMAKRLKLGLRPELYHEFDEWIADMGYESFKASPMLRQLLFESFIGGWGAKVRQNKRNQSMGSNK